MFLNDKTDIKLQEILNRNFTHCFRIKKTNNY